jgi:fumarate hydratase class II
VTDRSEAEPRRTEHDSMGSIEVPADRYWGAQTQRSLLHFAIGDQRMPIAVVRALGLVKVAAARVNARLGVLAPELADVIERAAHDVADGRFDAEFPLSVWQTGSGTQTNMNVNEVVAARANELLGHGIGGTSPVHPNDHVNRSQSSNDAFPTAMHVATVAALIHDVLPAVTALRAAIAERAERWAGVVKIGRTHLQDAVPLTVGQEW